VDIDGLAGLPWDKPRIGNGKSGVVRYKIGNETRKIYIDKNGNIDTSKSSCEKSTRQVNSNQVQDLTSKELERPLKEAKGSHNDAKRIESNFDALANFIGKFF